MADPASDFILPSTQKPAAPALEEGQERARDFRMPSQPEPTPYEKDWGQASTEEVAKGFAKEFFPSVGRGIAGIPEAIHTVITQPGQVGEGLKQAGTGIASKVRGALGEVQEPTQKAQDEAVINAMIEPFSSWAGFKKALATDPYSVLSVLAIPVSGGASAIGAGAKALGTASTAGKLLRGAELVGKGAAMTMDPLYGAVKGAGLAYEGLAKPAIKGTLAAQTGVPKAAIETAYEAGRTTEEPLKTAFNTFAKGQGNPVQFSRAVEKASTAMRDAEMSAWKADKANILALRQPVDPQPIMQAIQDARDAIGPRSMTFGTSLRAHRELDHYENLLLRKLQNPRQSTLQSMDVAKRTLWDEAQAARNPMTSNALLSLHNGVRQSMFKVSPDYVNLMDKYKEMLDTMKTVKKSLNTGDNASAIRELNTFIRSMDDQYKGQFIAELAKYDPRIPYMVAGSSFYQAAGNPSKWPSMLTIGQLANFGWGLQRGDPVHMTAAAFGLGAQKLFGSPTAVRGMAETAGSIAGPVGRAVEKLPEGTGEVLGTAARILPGQLSRVQNEPLMESIREGRATGGRVSDKLVAEVDRAKKRINNQTEELLKTPDTSVAQALEVANRHLEG